MDEGALREQNEVELQRACEAAREGRLDVMLEALGRSHVLDGLIRRLQMRWRALDRADIEDAVSEAVDAACVALQSSRPVENLVGYLWKVADRMAARCVSRNRKHVREVAFTDIQEPGHAETGTNVDMEDENDDIDDLHPDERRRLAFRVARGWLPRLGQANVQRVMAYAFDCVEAGAEDLSPKLIGEALGLKANTVSKSLERGFERLERVAREEGIARVIEELVRMRLGSS